MTDQDDEVTFEVGLAAQIPQANLFHREQPASLEGPPESWELARSTIDFGCAVFSETSGWRPEREVRDLVMMSLLRRATVTAEGVIVLLAAGLQEPAMATTRTLLDIVVAMRLICNDPTDRLAKRLAAYHYVAMQSHGQDMLSDPDTRNKHLLPFGRVSEIQGIASSYKRLLEAGTLAEVEKEVRQARYWHGYSNVEEAYRAADQITDYHMTYDTATWFVHVANIEHDLIDRSGRGITIRAFVERDPRIVQMLLGYAVLRYIEIIGLFIKDRGLPDTEVFRAKSDVVFPDGQVTQIDAYTALSMRVGKAYNPPSNS